MTDNELENLVSELNAIMNEIYSLESRWREINKWKEGETGSIVYPPASSDDIRDLETRMGKKFPPSYVQFLRIHDGWKHFWLDFTLIGAIGEHANNVLDNFAETKEWQNCRLRQKLCEITPEAIEAWEAKDPSNVYLESQLVFGADFAGSLYLFDTRNRLADREMAIRHWSIANGASHDESFEEDYLGGPSVPNFGEMLQVISNRANKYLARVKRSKGKRKK